jgi:Helicase conserved C-terminal domain
MRSLRQCLLDADAVVLRIIAERWSLAPIGLKPRELVDRLEETISDPARATPILGDLPNAEREALRVLLAAGGTLPIANFAQRFGSVRSVGPARLEREQLWRSPISPAENLWYLGLLYRGFEQLPNGAMREVFFAPVELTPLLPLLKAPDRSVEPLEITATPTEIRSSGEALADDVCTLLSHLHNNFVRSSDPRLRSVIEPLRATLTAQLRDTHPARLEFLLHHAERARLIKLAGQRLRPDPQRSTDWLRAPSLDQLRVLFDAWRTNTAWHDLQRAHVVHVEKAVSLRSDAVAVRAAILDSLQAAVPGAWHTFAALFARMKVQSPDFLRADFDTDYLRAAATGEYLRGFAAWDRVEGALVQQVLSGPLYWLGLIELDASTTSFCVTTRGAQLLGLTHEAVEAAQVDRLFTVRSDATIHISAARRYDRFQVARVADLIAVVAAGAGDEYRYRLMPSSLTRANSQKIPTEKVLAYLDQAADHGVPPTLAKAIQRWASKGTEVKVERAVIVQVKDAAILKRLQESPKTRGLAIEPLGPTAARINEKDWPKLVAILAEAGVLVD